MNQEKIKKDNKKAFPKYLLVMVLCGILGGIIGFVSAAAGGAQFGETLTQAANAAFKAAVPYMLPVSAAILLGSALFLYLRSRKRAEAWDGENEEEAAAIDRMLSAAIMLSTLLTPVQMFGISSAMVYYFLESGAVLFVVAAEVLASLVLEIMLSRRVVDLVRRMNPEKKGSIYDLNFQKKWLGSCDENERRQIGEASYLTYRATVYTCIVLWAVLLLMHIIFHVGILPSAVVFIIFTVMIVTYCTACIRMTK